MEPSHERVESSVPSYPNVNLDYQKENTKKYIKPQKWCATRQVDKLNNENFFFPGTVYVPGCLCNVF